jgi:hypothetical protein
MTKDELVDYLKANLEIEVDFSRFNRMGTNCLTVKLKLDGEIITESYTYICPKERSSDDW